LAAIRAVAQAFAAIGGGETGVRGAVRVTELLEPPLPQATSSNSAAPSIKMLEFFIVITSGRTAHLFYFYAYEEALDKPQIGSS